MSDLSVQYLDHSNEMVDFHTILLFHLRERRFHIGVLD
jgi:hypothetical protein